MQARTITNQTSTPHKGYYIFYHSINTVLHHNDIALRRVVLTPQESDLLDCLARQADCAVSRKEINQFLYGERRIPVTNSLEVIIGRLRRKLAPLKSHPVILTVRGHGYKLVQTVIFSEPAKCDSCSTNLGESLIVTAGGTETWICSVCQDKEHAKLAAAAAPQPQPVL